MSGRAGQIMGGRGWEGWREGGREGGSAGGTRGPKGGWLLATEAPGSKSVCAINDAPMKVEQTMNLSVAVSVRLTHGTRNSHRNSPLSTYKVGCHHECMLRARPLPPGAPAAQATRRQGQPRGPQARGEA